MPRRRPAGSACAGRRSGRRGRRHAGEPGASRRLRRCPARRLHRPVARRGLTLGVLAFGSTARASDFYDNLPPARTRPPAAGAGGARHARRAVRRGRTTAGDRAAGRPYVVLAVAGYADGRPASTDGERRDVVFHPATQPVTAVAAPLASRRRRRAARNGPAPIRRPACRPAVRRRGRLRWRAGVFDRIGRRGDAEAVPFSRALGAWIDRAGRLRSVDSLRRASPAAARPLQSPR